MTAPAPTEQAALDRIEAAADAPEALRSRVAVAIDAALESRCPECFQPKATTDDWQTIPEGEGEHLCWMPGFCGFHVDGLSVSSIAADAAIAVMRGDA